MGVYNSRIWGEETPQRIEPNFFLVEDIHDVITHPTFGDYRLRGSGVVAEGREITHAQNLNP